ncbi:unnamed protein product [Protopolystoma xenopodis]|uniref:Uncharacterized protein n=1 Tax=Protopolystoma xenopodis TaxID=117903 RepID=A0A3S5BRC7_9PLAT|nr:unnamed protein product [Protopolystoma xenopodis]
MTPFYFFHQSLLGEDTSFLDDELDSRPSSTCVSSCASVLSTPSSAVSSNLPGDTSTATKTAFLTDSFFKDTQLLALPGSSQTPALSQLTTVRQSPSEPSFSLLSAGLAVEACNLSLDPITFDQDSPTTLSIHKSVDSSASSADQINIIRNPLLSNMTPAVAVHFAVESLSNNKKGDGPACYRTNVNAHCLASLASGHNDVRRPVTIVQVFGSEKSDGKAVMAESRAIHEDAAIN